MWRGKLPWLNQTFWWACSSGIWSVWDRCENLKSPSMRMALRLIMGKPEVAKRVPCSTIFCTASPLFTAFDRALRCLMILGVSARTRALELLFYWPRWSVDSSPSLQGHQAEIGHLERPLPSPWAAGAPCLAAADGLMMDPRLLAYDIVSTLEWWNQELSKWYDHVWSIWENIWKKSI